VQSIAAGQNGWSKTDWEPKGETKEREAQRRRARYTFLVKLFRYASDASTSPPEDLVDEMNKVGGSFVSFIL